jgi:hypothetical protein
MLENAWIVGTTRHAHILQMLVSHEQGGLRLFLLMIQGSAIVEPDTFIHLYYSTLWFGSLLGNDYLCKEQCVAAPTCNVETFKISSLVEAVCVPLLRGWWPCVEPSS